MKYTFIGTATLAAVALTLTACGTTAGEPVAARSSSPTAPSSTAPANADQADAGRAAAARLGLPYLGTDVGTVEGAAKDGKPYVFGTGRGCAWVRLSPDGALYALHDNGTGSSRLTRDRGTEAAWRADPDYEPGRCTPAEGIPTVDDPSAPEPFRWTADYGNTYVRWHGQVYILPGTVGVGLALTPIAGETIPGVNGVPIPPPATIPN
ncbi:hypothetical protein [Tsukamurella pseudospumae]|uniref:Lipoprotein n=1 Tax=Tsukamurella pseudospumae TaxID=239498 RepID=A0A138AUE1_9ACTN|nr:hypothetical protein [Tsukamurella pseudospumae]KXO98951.1 hypothetical protein AXK61_18585 [Tsukamurella pseudospumae]KXP14029.1 hypothetical protein AXK60_22505 [Tsukamurella pseudospumae]